MSDMDRITWPFQTREEVTSWLLGAPMRIALIILGAIVVRWLVHRAIRSVVAQAVARADSHEKHSIERIINSATGIDQERRRQRALTMGTLLRSIATFVIGAVTILTVMAELGLPLGPLLTSAGIGGLAIGFGAQTLVKDFISGIFMIIEDQYGVGDVIDVGEAIGTVEEVTLRVTRLRDATGVVWFVRNGEIIRVGNRSHGWALAMIDIPVSYQEDPARVGQMLARVAADMYADPQWSEQLLEEPTVAGVESVSGGTITLRVMAKTRPGQQFAVPREFRGRAKQAFDEAGIQGPPIFPGTAQP